MPDAVEAATAHDPRTVRRRAGRGDRSRRHPPGSAPPTLRFERIAGLGGSDISADEAVASLERLGFAVQSRDADARHRRGAVLAQRRRGGGRSSNSRRRSIPPSPRRPPKAAPRSNRNATWSRRCCACAASMRCRRSRCRASRRCRSPTLTPKQARTALVAPHAGGPGPGRVRHLQLHGAGGGGAVRRHAGGAAPDQPDRRRSGPASADADRHAGARRAAQRRARLSPTWRCSRSARLRASTPRRSQRWIAAGLRAGATPRNWLVRTAAGRRDGRQGRSVGRS